MLSSAPRRRCQLNSNVEPRRLAPQTTNIAGAHCAPVAPCLDQYQDQLNDMSVEQQILTLEVCGSMRRGPAPGSPGSQSPTAPRSTRIASDTRAVTPSTASPLVALQPPNYPGQTPAKAGVRRASAPPPFASWRSSACPASLALARDPRGGGHRPAAVLGLYSAPSCRQHLQRHLAVTTCLNWALPLPFSAPLIPLAHKNPASYTCPAAEK